MKQINRAKLRGKPLDTDCKTAKTTTGEYGKDDRRVFCYGWIDAETDEYLTKCTECGAFVENAKPLEGGMKQHKATDLITKQAAAEIYCRGCEKKPNNEKHCEEVCMGYANIMCIEPAFDKDKVIEQLQYQIDQYHRREKEAKAKGFEREEYHNFGKACSYEFALEIVKGGGRNER